MIPRSLIEMSQSKGNCVSKQEMQTYIILRFLIEISCKESCVNKQEMFLK